MATPLRWESGATTKVGPRPSPTADNSERQCDDANEARIQDYKFPIRRSDTVLQKGISKAFDRAVRRYLSKTVKIGFEKLAHGIEVFQCFQDGGVGNCTRTLFKSKDAAVAFLRCIASNVDKPIAVDVKDYTGHSEDDEILKSLCSFRAVESIIHRRPRCECGACEHLVEHAGPHVKLIEALKLSETFVPDGCTPDMFYGWYAVSPTGRDSEMFYRYGYGYPSTRQKTSMTDLSSFKICTTWKTTEGCSQQLCQSLRKAVTSTYGHCSEYALFLVYDDLFWTVFAWDPNQIIIIEY